MRNTPDNPQLSPKVTKFERESPDKLERILQSYIDAYLPKEKEELSYEEKKRILNKIFKNQELMGSEGPRELIPGKKKEDFIGQNRHLHSLTKNETGEEEVIHVWFGDMYTTDAEDLQDLGVFLVVPESLSAASNETKVVKRDTEFIIVNGKIYETDKITKEEIENQLLPLETVLECSAQKAARNDLLKDLEAVPNSLKDLAKLEKKELRQILMTAVRKKWLQFEVVRKEIQKLNTEDEIPKEVFSQLIDLKKDCLERFK